MCSIGIDLGGTNMRGGRVAEKKLQSIFSQKVNAQGSVNEVLQELYLFTDKIMNADVKSIGIGVPGLVDIDNGVVYDVEKSALAAANGGTIPDSRFYKQRCQLFCVG